MNRQEKESLVDRIYQVTGCSYLSDLRLPKWRKKLPETVREIGFSMYSLKQWSYAISYILDHEVSFASEKELMDFLSEIDQSQAED